MVIDRLGAIGTTDILLELVVNDDIARVWKFSSGTVARIPAIYQEYGYGYLGEHLPDFMFEFYFLGLQLWPWACLLSLCRWRSTLR